MTDPDTIGREPFTIVEIDQDQCTLVYGVAPCEAELGVTGTIKCFNTLISCQDEPHYTKGTLTLRFCRPSSDLPRDINLFPTLTAVSSTPTEINVGGGDSNTSPLGLRSGVTINLSDHPYHDRLVDKYWSERDYDAFTRGTFWAKWLARNPYYVGRNIRVLDGYIGQALADMQTRHYVLDRIEGPTNGEVTIIAKDPIKLTDADRAQAPVANTGILLADLTAGMPNSLVLSPTGVGNLEYPTSGIARIGSELIQYTRSGDSVTIVARGLRTTEAIAHEEGELMQDVLVFERVRVDEVIQTLLVDYTGLDTSFFNFPAWQAEADRWLTGYLLSTWITEPTGVGQLLGEIVNQCQCYIWWDERNQEIGFRALHPVLEAFGEVIHEVNSDEHIIEGSLSIEDKPDERVSQVWIYYDQINPLAGVDDPVNYARLRVEADNAAESADQFNERRITKILSRWMDSRNSGETLTSARRRIERYRFNPVVIQFSVDAKDRDLMPSDILDLTHPDLVDLTGTPEAKRLQIVSYEDTIPGHLTSYKARPYGFIGGQYAFVMPDGSPTYSDASPSQLLIAGFIAPNTGIFANGTQAYRIV